MIIGIGIDIIETARVERIEAEYGSELTDHLFTEHEVAYCKDKADPTKHYAARFAAKEAFLKALGSGLSSGINWRDIEVIRDEFGNPSIKYSGRAAEFAEKLGVTNAHLSISHSDNYAAAVVVLENRNLQYT